MRLRKYLAICSLCVFGIIVARADTVTLTVVQNEKAPVIAMDMSNAIEDEIFGCYYDAGHITSNTEIRLDGSRFKDTKFGIKEAAFGLSDFLVVIDLQYGPAEITDNEHKITYAELDTLTWRLVEVKSSKIIVEKKIDVKNIKVTDFDPYKRSRFVAQTTASDSLSAIAKFKEGRDDK